MAVGLTCRLAPSFLEPSTPLSQHCRYPSMSSRLALYFSSDPFSNGPSAGTLKARATRGMAANQLAELEVRLCKAQPRPHTAPELLKSLRSVLSLH